MNQRKCPTCGEYLPEDAVFCPNCGNKISDGVAAEQEEAIQKEAILQEKTVSQESEQVVSSGKKPRKKPSRKSIIITVVSVVFVAIIAFVAWYLVDQHNKQIWEQEHQKYSVNIVISAKGYDPATSTPIPIHIEGTDFEGNTVSEDHLIGSQSAESLLFMRGTYSLTVVSSPITSDGTVYSVPDAAATFEITGETTESTEGEAEDGSSDNSNNENTDGSIEIGSVSDGSNETNTVAAINIAFEPMDPLSVTNEYIESIAIALIDAGMDKASVQQFKDAAIAKVQQASEEQRKQEIASKIEELEAEYTAAENYNVIVDPNGGQSSDNEAAQKHYEKWDSVMNDIYDYLSSVLSEANAAQLASEQADWEDYRSAEMEKSRQSGMGSSFTPSFVYTTGSNVTADRARTLLDQLYTLV